MGRTSPPVLETVRRSDGSDWERRRHNGARSDPRAIIEHTRDGIVVTVLSTRDRVIGAEKAASRWERSYPDQPLPEPREAWRRKEIPFGVVDLAQVECADTASRAVPCLVYGPGDHVSPAARPRQGLDGRTS